MKTLIALLILMVAVGGCSTTDSPETAAERITMDQLTKTPGYAWFVAEMSAYSPAPTYTSQITTSMNDNASRKVCVFVKPTCSCRGTQKLFPQVMKTLADANIDMSRVEVWSMRNNTDSHPYQPNINISNLPEIYVLDGDQIRARIFEGLYSDSNADSLIAAAVATK